MRFYRLVLWNIIAGTFLTLLQQQQASGKAVFSHSATVWSSAGTLHVDFPLEMDFLESECDRLQDETTYMAQELTRPANVSRRTIVEKKGTELALRSINGTVVRTCREQRAWPNLFHDHHSIVERQVIGLTLGTVFGALIVPEVSSWFTHSSTHLEEELADTRRTIREMADFVADFMDDAAAETRTTKHLLLLEASVAGLKDTVNSYSTAFTHLVANHRLTPPLLPFDKAVEVWTKYRALRGADALPFGPEAAYELPASYKLEGTTLHLLLHLPCLTDPFRLYNYRSFPFPTPEGPVLLRPADRDHLLVVHEESTKFFILSPQDLTACLHLGHQYVCHQQFVLLDFESTCLSALFTGHHEAAMRQCDVTPVNVPWVLTAVGGDIGGWFRLWTSQPMPYTQRCANGTTNADIFPVGESRFFNSDHCSLSSRKFQLQPRLERHRVETIVRDFQLESYTAEVSQALRPVPGQHLRPYSEGVDHFFMIGSGCAVAALLGISVAFCLACYPKCTRCCRKPSSAAE